jgi:type I restriction enzyme S subunit
MSTETIDMVKKNTLVPALRFKEFDGDWNFHKLEEIVSKKISYGIVQAGEHVDGGMPYIKSKDINGPIILDTLERTSDEIAKKYVRSEVRPGDIIFSLRGNIGIAQILPDSIKVANLTQGTARISVSNKYANYFVYQSLYTLPVIKRILCVSKGSTFQEISLADLRNVKIVSPSLPEQQKIASFLSAVDEKIQQLTKKKELLLQYKKGVMQQLFSGKLRFKDENGNDYPDWEEKRLGDIVTLMQSGISRKLSDADIGLPILRSNNLQGGQLDVTDIKYWFKKDDKGANLENYVLQEGDMLVNFINSLAQIGKIAMFTDLLNRKTIYTTNLMRLRFNNEVVNGFMFNYFHLKKYENFIQSITKPAVNQASFTTKEFKTFEVNLPCIKEQQKIATYLSSIDTKIESVNQQITQTQTFKKGLLQKMFV